MKKIGLLVLICLFTLLLGGCTKNVEKENENDITEDSVLPENPVADNTADNATGSENIELIPEDLVLNIQDFYMLNTGDPGNLYYIDEKNVLWGCGRNNYGQLGQGTQDYDFHEEMVKIAEDVIHVDYSQTGFTIYLTKDHKLYGMGNAGSGALQQYETFDWTRFANGEHYYVSEPYLLMENVIYVCCGRDDIACLTEDGAVWVWGTIYFMGSPWSHNECFVEKPKKILENAVLVTGGWFNHAALLQDGTVWTWGYNGAGNCGIEEPDLVGEPTMVAEDVVMVWTNFEVDNYPQPDTEDIAMAWTGRKKYNTEYDDITEFDGIYPMSLNNTVIRKSDGSYWVCGENVGTEEKVVHGAEADYSVICTYEFSLINTGSADENANQTEEPDTVNPDELEDMFGISISLPENPNWIVNSEYHLIDENHLEITYHDSITDSDCVVLAAKNADLILPEIEYDETLNESWEGRTINGQNIVVKVQRGKNDRKTILATWEYNEYQFAIIGEIEGEGDSGPIAKAALSIIYGLN